MASTNLPITAVQIQQPVVGGQVNPQAFPVKTLKVFGGVQIGIGVLLGILSLIGVVFYDKGLHKECGQLYYEYSRYDWKCSGNEDSVRSLFAFDVTCFILSGWYIMTGCLPLCMSRPRENSWRGLKVGFMVCSIIGAAIFVPTLFSLGVVGSIIRTLYDDRIVVLSAFIALLSFVELIVAIVSASFCCCCTPWRAHQPVSVIYMNTSQPGLMFNLPQAPLMTYQTNTMATTGQVPQAPLMTYQTNTTATAGLVPQAPLMTHQTDTMATAGQPENTTFPSAQKYHVMTTNQPMSQQLQSMSDNQPVVVST